MQGLRLRAPLLPGAGALDPGPARDGPEAPQARADKGANGGPPDPSAAPSAAGGPAEARPEPARAAEASRPAAPCRRPEEPDPAPSVTASVPVGRPVPVAHRSTFDALHSLQRGRHPC